MRFEARELKPYAEPVSASELKEGEVYFSIQYADDALLIPIVETLVFAGRNLNQGDSGERLYFQDVESYAKGIRYATATDETAAFYAQSVKYLNHIFDYEHALENLMNCSLRRRKIIS